MVLTKYKLFPIAVFFTSLFVPKRFGGYNVGPINFVKPQYKYDIGLVNHEIHHSRQFWSNPIKYTFGRWLKYFRFLPKSIIRWSERKTYEYELDAYSFQVAIYVRKRIYPIYEAKEVLIPKFVQYIIEKYNIKHLKLVPEKVESEMWSRVLSYISKLDDFKIVDTTR